MPRIRVKLSYGYLYLPFVFLMPKDMMAKFPILSSLPCSLGEIRSSKVHIYEKEYRFIVQHRFLLNSVPQCFLRQDWPLFLRVDSPSTLRNLQ